MTLAHQNDPDLVRELLVDPGTWVVVGLSNNRERAAWRIARWLKVEQRKGLIKRYLKKDDPLKILVVCDMLLTGFDAPIEMTCDSTSTPIAWRRNARAIVPAATRAAVSRALARSRTGRASSKPYLSMPA
jgi:hypothetical protein